jgi:hypothetical protein
LLESESCEEETPNAATSGNDEQDEAKSEDPPPKPIPLAVQVQNIPEQLKSKTNS